MPADPEWVEIIAIRKGEAPNVVGHFECLVSGCECFFFDRLSWLLHSRRGQHGRLFFGDTFRKISRGYAEKDRAKRALYKQGKL